MARFLVFTTVHATISVEAPDAAAAADEVLARAQADRISAYIFDPRTRLTVADVQEYVEPDHYLYPDND